MYTRDTPATTGPARHRQHRRRPTWLILAVVAALVLVGAFVTVRYLSAPAAPEATAPIAGQWADGKAPAPTDAPVKSCGKAWESAPEMSPNLLVAPPTRWELVGGMAAPTSKAAGPALFTGGVRSCYAHTPPGALFAVTNYLAQMQDPTATPGDQVALARAAMVDMPGRDRFAEQWATPKPVAPQKERPVFVAFHFTAYTKDLAVIDLASTWNGQLNAAQYRLRYTNGSWLLDPPDPGGWPTRQLPAEDPNYWTHWSAAE